MKKNLALTGSNGFLGSSLYKKIHNDYKVLKISLKNKIEIQKFLEKLSNNSYDIIINAAAALQPKSKYEIFNTFIPTKICDSFFIFCSNHFDSLNNFTISILLIIIL